MFYFQSRSQEMFVYHRVCEEYLYTPDTNCTDDDRQTARHNSVAIARPY